MIIHRSTPHLTCSFKSKSHAKNISPENEGDWYRGAQPFLILAFVSAQILRTKKLQKRELIILKKEKWSGIPGSMQRRIVLNLSAARPDLSFRPLFTGLLHVSPPKQSFQIARNQK